MTPFQVRGGRLQFVRRPFARSGLYKMGGNNGQYDPGSDGFAAAGGRHVTRRMEADCAHTVPRRQPGGVLKELWPFCLDEGVSRLGSVSWFRTRPVVGRFRPPIERDWSAERAHTPTLVFLLAYLAAPPYSPGASVLSKGS
jgi:hypothetical protein